MIDVKDIGAAMFWIGALTMVSGIFLIVFFGRRS